MSTTTLATVLRRPSAYEDTYVVFGAPFLTAVTGHVPRLRFAIEGVRETQNRGARRDEGGVGPT